ncbi:Arm DNA-binding domain-containing protein [Stutzerimonas stutzeri]|uniref:Arm DNA-binding domain-containing protein n=1 Tax=Stutzerimonas stutzeri TaxID=316 RepID=UPI0034D3EF5C
MSVTEVFWTHGAFRHSSEAGKPTGRDYTTSDSNGLALLVHRNGSKYWTFRYSHQGKRRKCR